MLVSIIIPAHNEEKYIGKCIGAIRKAEEYAKVNTQIIVVANRCTDRTAAIASSLGAEVYMDESKCLSRIRNVGATKAKGKILVTIDVDSCMTETSLREICNRLRSGKYIGGGAMPDFDRWSLGIAVSTIYIAIHLLPVMFRNKAALSGTMFWCYKKSFDEIGGFDESLVSMEDMDFAIRLKRLGDSRGLKYGTLNKSKVITSSRKFDEFGDWYLIKNRKHTKAIFTGRDQEAADKFYYDVR